MENETKQEEKAEAEHVAGAEATTTEVLTEPATEEGITIIDDFFNYGKHGEIQSVNCDLLTDFVLRCMPMVYVRDSGELMTYQNGRYVRNGRDDLKKFLVNLLKPYVLGSGKCVFNKSLFSEVVTLIEGKTQADLKDFDANLKIVNLKNGLYNWHTGEIRPHDPAYLSRIQMPVVYNKDATCPNIENFLKIVLKHEDIDKVLEFFGFMMYRRYPTRKAFIVWGPTGTGKSYLLDLLSAFAGNDNTSSVSLHELVSDRFAGADLYGKLLNGCGDISSEVIKETNVLKGLISDKDSMRVQRKHEHAFQFVNFAKIFFSTNGIPAIAKKDSAWYKRFELIEMTHTLGDMELDPGLSDTMSSEEELSGLFNLAVEGLKRLVVDNWQFTNQRTLKETEALYEELSDTVGTFATSYLEYSEGLYVTREHMYEEYKRYCEGLKVKPLRAGAEFSGALRIACEWLKDVKANDNRKIVNEEYPNGKNFLVWPNTIIRNDST